MFRFIFTIALLTTIFVALLVLARAVGGQVKNPLVNMFTEVTRADGQHQVCWRGICPGLTTADEARAILATDPSLTLAVGWTTDDQPCWKNTLGFTAVCLVMRDAQIEQIFLSGGSLPTIHLGELVTLWGTPLKSSIGPLCYESYVLFSNNVVVYTDEMVYKYHYHYIDDMITFQLDSRSRIYRLWIYASAAKIDIDHLAIGASLTTWQGFGKFQGPLTNCGH